MFKIPELCSLWKINKYGMNLISFSHMKRIMILTKGKIVMRRVVIMMKKRRLKLKKKKNFLRETSQMMAQKR